MKVSRDETADLMDAIRFALSVMVACDDEDLQRIANAYGEGVALAATIALDGKGSARPRVLACLERHTTCKAAGDVASIGWMLAAIQERVNEGDLFYWRKLKKVVDTTIKQLPPPEKPILH